MIEQLLQDIGLSEKESATYLALLKYGSQSITFLAKKINFNRGTAYVILHSLLAKGLVVQTTKGEMQFFSALPPQQLINYLDYKKEQILGQKQKIQTHMNELLKLQPTLSSQPKVQFFDGAEGARALLQITLNAKEKTLNSFLSIYDIADFVGADYFNDYTTKRVKKRYKLHAIRTREKDKLALSKDIHAKRYNTSKKEHREVRYIDDDLAFPVTMYMFDDKLGIISSKEENFALLIQSKELTNMHKKLFNVIWGKLAKKS